MRHRKAGRTFGRDSAHRQALMRNLATALLMHGRITTTEAKAKELRRWVERVITKAKPADFNAHRRAAGYINDRVAHDKLFSTYVDRYRDRMGGYTRIIHVGPRAGDAAEMAIIELVSGE